MHTLARVQLKHRFEYTYYLPMFPSYLVPQPGGKG